MNKRQGIGALGQRAAGLLAATSMLLLLAGGGGKAFGQDIPAGLAQVSNGYLRLVVDNIPGDEPQGDFALLATGGDPLTGADNFQVLSDRVDPYPQDMRTIVAVDWTPAGGGQFLRFGSRSEGTDIQLGEPDPVRQRIIAEWRDSGGLLNMRETLTLLRDVVEMRYRLTNMDTASHTYGLRVTLDIRPNATGLAAGENQLPETPVFVPGSGPIDSEIKYQAGNVPDRWWCGVPTVQQSTVIGGFLANFATARRPDEFYVGNLANLQAQLWGFSPAEVGTIEDAGVGLRWNPVRLSPNQSVEFVTYFGYASASGDYSSPFVLAAVALPRLSLRTGDNPDTAETESFYIFPDLFEVRGHVYNVSDLPQGNAVLYLSLPEGLEFSIGDSPSKLIDTVPAHTEKMVSWSVHPTGRPAGTLAYLLSANISPSAARAVSREIQVPPVSGTDLPAGVQMLSVPLALANGSPDVAISLVPTSALRMARWNTDDGEYIVYPEPGFGVLERGRAYWLRVDVRSALGLMGASPPGAQDAFVSLEAGWNQIGGPFELPIEWGRVKVAFEDQTLTLQEAVRKGLLRSTLFRWDPVLHEYRWSLDMSYKLQPWEGYWVKANLPCTLVFERVETSRERVPVADEGRLGVSRVSSGGWGMELVASAGGDEGKCVVGVSAQARDGYDAQDVEAPPPALGAAVEASIPHSDWGPAAGRYLQDVRRQSAAGGRWEIEVRTKEPFQDVLLTWTDLRQVPKDLAVWMERLDTGERVSMRTAQSMAMNSGADGSARVAIVVGGAGEVLVVSTPQLGGVKGALTFSFNLSMDAQVKASVSNLAGVLVRELASGFALSAGNESLVWDERDEEGRRVPAGAYVLEIEALGWDGQRFVSSRTFNLQ